MVELVESFGREAAPRCGVSVSPEDLRGELARSSTDPDLRQIAALVDWIDGSQPLQYLDVILDFIAANGEAELGAPGPLVHAAERFLGRGYGERLLRSVERCPTEHNIWMVNRLADGASGQWRTACQDLLRRLVGRPDVSRGVRELAIEFLGEP